jgi:hypothetical protein
VDVPLLSAAALVPLSVFVLELMLLAWACGASTAATMADHVIVAPEERLRS